jgi:hypothetical protein
MTRIISYTLTALSLVLFLSACSRTAREGAATTPTPAATPAQGPATSVRFVSASAADVQLAAGGSADAIVTLKIQNGYHVNANPPTFPYLRPTALVVQTGDGVSVGFITYPTAVSKQFSFEKSPLAVYEGSAAIKVTLKAKAEAAKGPRALPAELSIQACDDKVCYPPGTLPLSLPITVK